MSLSAQSPALVAKSVKEHLGRAKSYANRGDAERALVALIEGLKQYLQSKLFGREKSEVDVTLYEAVRAITPMPDVRRLAPGGVPIKKGEERQLLVFLHRLLKGMLEGRERAAQDAMRVRLKALDKYLVQAGKLAAEGKHPEAKRAFRSAVEQNPDVPGLASDVGSRMNRAGYFPEALDMFKRALERDPRDIRAHGGMATAFEGIGHFAEAEETLREALKQFGGRGRIHYRLAKVMKAQGKIMDALNAARLAASLDPGLEEAKVLEAELRAAAASGQTN